MLFKTESFDIHEAQLTRGDFGAWRPYLFTEKTKTVELISVRTHGGSISIGNPSFTNLIAPSGRPAILVGNFIFSQGAGINEAGELLFYREYQLSAQASAIASMWPSIASALPALAIGLYTLHRRLSSRLRHRRQRPAEDGA